LLNKYKTLIFSSLKFFCGSVANNLLLDSNRSITSEKGHTNLCLKFYQPQKKQKLSGITILLLKNSAAG